jgi:hypothetical protein
VFQECDVADLNTAERWWIAFGRACGWPLTNSTDGGQEHVTLSDEVRQHISRQMKALWADERFRARCSRGRRERVLGDANPAKRPDVRAKLSAAAVAREQRRREQRA